MYRLNSKEYVGKSQLESLVTWKEAFRHTREANVACGVVA